MTAVDVISNLLLLFAGIGVFLIATKLLSSNLEAVGGNKLRQIFAKTAKNKFLGVGVGTFGTALIQSSGATSVMVIGFVNAGIMTLAQAAPIILGANIGTTITAQIVAIGLTTGGANTLSATVIFSALAGIGALMMYFGKKDITKKVGGALGGLGLLFVGLNTMSSAMKPFAGGAVKDFIASINFPGYSFVLTLVGIILTAVIQSSSVTSSIAITMFMSGLITADQGVYLILGSNIGAVVVAMLACIGSSTNAKRVAIFHLITNVVRVVGFLVVVEIIVAATSGRFTVGGLFAKMFPHAPQFQLAMFHTLFNVITILLMALFTNFYVKLAEKLVKEKPVQVDENAPHLFFLEERLLRTPPIAMAQLKNEVINMAEIAKTNFDLCLDAVSRGKVSEKLDEIQKNENTLNFINREMSKYLVKLSQVDLSETDNIILSTTYHTISDIERIGDYAENISEYAEKLEQSNATFSKDAIEEIENLKSTINNLYDAVMKSYKSASLDYISDVNYFEENVDKLKEDMGERHIERLNAGTCSPEIGAIYISLASNAERVADHMTNIAYAVKSYAKKTQKK